MIYSQDWLQSMEKTKLLILKLILPDWVTLPQKKLKRPYQDTRTLLLNSGLTPLVVQKNKLLFLILPIFMVNSILTLYLKGDFYDL